MQRLVLRVITALVAFVIGLVAWAISLGFGAVMPGTTNTDTRGQAHYGTAEVKPVKAGGCQSRNRY